MYDRASEMTRFPRVGSLLFSFADLGFLCIELRLMLYAMTNLTVKGSFFGLVWCLKKFDGELPKFTPLTNTQDSIIIQICNVVSLAVVRVHIFLQPSGLASFYGLKK